MNRLLSIIVALLSCQAVSSAQLFSDNFDVDSSANWMVNNNLIGTNAANFSFDYSTIGVPSAPNSGGTTIGLKFGVNLDPAQAVAPGQIPGISVSPTGESFTGDYVMKFDWWSNYIGPLNVGTTGSTTLSTFGIMSSGTTANFPGSIDGVVFAATGDGQSSADYRIYSPERQGSYDVFADSNNPLDLHATYPAGSRNSTALLYMGTFPAGATAPGVQSSMPTQTESTPAGAAGFRWHEVSIERVGSIVTWTVNGALLGTVDSSFFSTGGSNILFGMSDTNNTTNADATLLEQLQFTLIDNVVVVPEPTSLGLLCMAGGILFLRRRLRRS